MEDVEIDAGAANPLDIIEMAAWMDITKYSQIHHLTTADFTFTAALWCYYSFSNVYQSYISGPFGQLLLS